MKDKKQQNEKKPKSRLVSFCVSATALILVFAVCFTFLIFSTDVVINIDMQNSTNYDVVKPTSVSVTIQQVENVAQNPSAENGAGDGMPVVPPDNTGITPPPNTTPIVDKDLKDWVDNCPIKFSNTQKQDTLALMYYVMNKNGYSDEQISGVLGNICCEGNVGRFEGIPYGHHSKDCKNGKVSSCYYENSWSNASIYSNFTDYTVAKYGNKAHEYSEIYSNKVAQNEGMTWEQLRTMFSATAPLSVAVYGFGSIQMTSGTYHTNFVNFIDSNGLSGTTDFYTIAEMETSNLLIKLSDFFNQNTPSGYSNLHKNCQFTLGSLQSSLGATTGARAEVVESSAVFFTQVEIGWHYKYLDENKRRAGIALTCYDDIKAAGY